MHKPVPPPSAFLAHLDSLADPVRLRLLRLLQRHELSVADLCDILQLPQSTVSRHLKILADQSWLHSRRQATAHLYRMTETELPPAHRRLLLLAREQSEPWPAADQDDLRLTRLLRDKQLDTQTFFASAAAQWDKLRSELYGHSFSISAMLALLPSYYVVADLGCGTGQISAELAPHVSQIIAVDNSPAMLKAARQRTSELPNVSLRRGDLSSLPIEDASCHAAVMVLSLTYAADPPAALAEMSRILKPAGRAVLVDLLPHSREDFRRHYGQLHLGFSPDSLSAMLSSASFNDISISSLPSDSNTKGPALFLAAATRL